MTIKFKMKEQQLMNICTIPTQTLTRTITIMQALGFTESDSAGQTNIFAVEPKSYVQGSQSDATSAAGTSTTGGAAIAGSVAVGAVVAGLILLNGDSDVADGPEAGLRSLTAYKNQFAGEIVAQAPAPVAVVEAAPEVVGE